MFSLQRIVGGDGEFYTLLEASAEQSVKGARALLELLKHPVDTLSMEPLAQIRSKSKGLTENIHKDLCRSFVTPLDREDIERLAMALYVIPKTMEKFMEQWQVSQPVVAGADFTPQIQIIAKTADIVFEMVKDVRNSPEMVRVSGQNADLQRLEGEADKLLLNLMKELYNGKYTAVQAQAICALYELLEKAVDRCRDAGNVLVYMALKLN